MLAVDNWTWIVEKVGIPLAVVIIGLVGSITVAVLTFALGRLNDAAARRRNAYAEATKQLVAYVEYPYRIRRRSSDSPDELTRLASLGHDLQEALTYHETWIRSENRWVAEVYKEVRRDLAMAVAAACNDAWETPPISAAGGMRLNGWGPRGTQEHIERFESAVAFRFGWRRALAAFGWRSGALPRPAPPQLADSHPHAHVALVGAEAPLVGGALDEAPAAEPGLDVRGA